MNLHAPSYERVERIGSSSNNSNNKICRICLEDDEPQTMIAPCKCKGSSKWVHRDCLDEWRLHEKDRAFSKCTECLFEYYLQPIYAPSSETTTTTTTTSNRNRQFQFYWKVSRDICVSIILLQLIIVALGAFLWICDTDNALPNQILPTFTNHPGSLYYLLGWLLLLIITGLYGSSVLCINGCSISRSLPTIDNTTPSTSRGPRTTTTTTTTGATMEDELVRDIGIESNTEFYRRARHRRRRRNYDYYNQNNHHNCCCANNNRYNNVCDGCYYFYCPYYGGGGDGSSSCCYCCCCDSGGGGGGGDCCETNAGERDCCCNLGGADGGGGNSNCDAGDNAHILLLILLVIAVILAVIGFFVGIVITVIAFQRIVQRHIHLLQKRQLIQEFRVMDLQEYDLDQPLPTAPLEEDLEEGRLAAYPTPTAPIEPLPFRDVAYLQKLGLMDKN